MPRHSEATLAAIKNAVDIVALVGESLPLHRTGSKFKALCPFHDDHNPSLELNPERQSYKCWSCGAGGDVFDFVQAYDRVDFPEALRMLAERAGVALENPSVGTPPRGPSKTDLLAVNAWAEQEFVEALGNAPEARAYLEERGLQAGVGRTVPSGFCPGCPRLADVTGPETRLYDRPAENGRGWSSRSSDPPGPAARSIPRPFDLSDPRPPGTDGRLRGANFALGGGTIGHSGQNCRKIP